LGKQVHKYDPITQSVSCTTTTYPPGGIRPQPGTGLTPEEIAQLLAMLALFASQSRNVPISRDRSRENDNQCDTFPYSNYLKCNSPAMHEFGETYNFPSFDAAEANIAQRSGANLEQLVVHPNAEGDIAVTGPCSRESGFTPLGRHWNIWRNRDAYRLRSSPDNIPPLGAIKKCTCCDPNISEGNPLVDRYTVVDSHNQLTQFTA
jgi:hypothetical protein